MAIEGKDKPAHPADLVICIDTLEHIEPDYLDAVLTDLMRCTKKVGYFIINTKAAGKTLPDGRNTHLIQEGKDWWKERIEKYFTIPKKGFQEKGPHLYVIASSKKGGKALTDKFTLTSPEKIKEEVCV